MRGRDANLIDGDHDGEGPHGDAGDGGQQVRVAEPASAVAPRTRRDSAFAASPPMTSTTSATTRLGSHSSNLLEYLRDRGQSKRIERGDQHDQAHEPLGERGQETGCIRVHAHLLDKAAEARRVAPGR